MIEMQQTEGQRLELAAATRAIMANPAPQSVRLNGKAAAESGPPEEIGLDPMLETKKSGTRCHSVQKLCLAEWVHLN
jgi:hypothetical protein